MIVLKENGGIPRVVLLMMSVVAGITVANLYYNQPLLEMMRLELGVTEVAASMITVITQIGYALGLFLIVPMGDLYARRKIVVLCMLTACISALCISLAQQVLIVWGASAVLGASSIVPQLFIPVAGQFSRPENKTRNMGIVLSGLLTGILASRVVSGFVGEWLGWRTMYVIAALLMVGCCVVCLRFLPDMKQNFAGNYRSLMHTVWQLFTSHQRIRSYSIRAAFGFGSMLALWSCLAFHIAGPPFFEGSDKVGVLGLCGVAGALVASGIGNYIPRYGVQRFSVAGGIMQLLAWAIAYLCGDSYWGLIVAIIVCDLGVQCLQLSNQGACIEEIPEASNRANTIFMTIYFMGGSLGTFCAGIGWKTGGWGGVATVGASFSVVSLLVSLWIAKASVRR